MKLSIEQRKIIEENKTLSFLDLSILLNCSEYTANRWYKEVFGNEKRKRKSLTKPKPVRIQHDYSKKSLYEDVYDRFGL